MNRRLMMMLLVAALGAFHLGFFGPREGAFGQVPSVQSGAASSHASGPSGDNPMGKFASKPGKWSVQVDERSNSLIVTAPLSKLDEIARLIEVMDNRTANSRMEERIFKLRYIDRKTLENAIRMILPRFDVKTQMIDVTTDDRRREAATTGGQGGSPSQTTSAPPPGR